MLDAFEDSDPELNSTAGVNIANACDSSDCELDPTAGVIEKETRCDAYDSDSSQPDALPKTAMPNVRPRQAKPKAVRDAFLPAFVRSGPPAKTVGDHLADIQMIPNEKQKLRKRIARLAVSDNKRLRMHEETHSAIAGCWNHLKLSRNERLPVGGGPCTQQETTGNPQSLAAQACMDHSRHRCGSLLGDRGNMFKCKWTSEDPKGN